MTLNLSALQSAATTSERNRNAQRATKESKAKGNHSKTTRTSRIKRCSRPDCNKTESETTFEPRARICSSCKQSADNSQLLKALLDAVNQYGTTKCFDSVEDIRSYLKIRAMKYRQFGTEYKKQDGEKTKRVWLFADLNICHIKPVSVGGKLQADNLFLWFRNENNFYKDRNKHLFPYLPLTNNKTKYTPSTLHAELLLRFGTEYTDLKLEKGLIPTTPKQGWREITGCDNQLDAHNKLLELGYTTEPKDDNYLESALLLEFTRCSPNFQEAQAVYLSNVDREELTTRDYTIIMHHMYSDYRFTERPTDKSQ